MRTRGGFRKPDRSREEPLPPYLRNVFIPALDPMEGLSDAAMAALADPRPILMEALRRGGTKPDLTRLMMIWQKKADKGMRPPAERSRLSARPRLLETPLDCEIAPVPLDLFLGLIDDCAKEYEQAVAVEFDALEEFVQASFEFGFEKKKGASKEDVAAAKSSYRREYYRMMRAAYYCAGYRDPAPAIFQHIQPYTLLGRVVSGGLHQDFIDKVQMIGRLLESWNTGMAKDVGDGIHGIGGFVPRFQAGTKVLSNHAFGLAIDLDPVVNPDINNKEEIAAIEEITGYNLGKDLEDFIPGVTPLDRVLQIHARLNDASKKLKVWLKETGKACEARDSSSPETAKQDNDERLMGVLVKRRNAATLDAWERLGIQTIPVAFAAAMAQLGFRWGGEYTRKKDVMHFELLDALPKEPAVTLEEMFDPAFDPMQMVFTLPGAAG